MKLALILALLISTLSLAHADARNPLIAPLPLPPAPLGVRGMLPPPLPTPQPGLGASGNAMAPQPYAVEAPAAKLDTAAIKFVAKNGRWIVLRIGDTVKRTISGGTVWLGGTAYIVDVSSTSVEFTHRESKVHAGSVYLGG